MKYAKGACQCQKIKFRVLMPVSWEGHCHCSQCQQLHGAAFVTWTGFKTDDFEIVDPKKYFKIFDSGTADRGFCLHCGSSFYFKYNIKSDQDEWKDYVYFARANIQTEIKCIPSQHIYYKSHVSWFSVLDDLPKREN